MGKIVVFFLVICILIGCKSTENYSKQVDASGKNVTTSSDNAEEKEKKDDTTKIVHTKELESIRQELTSHSDKLQKILAKIKDQQIKKDFEKIVADFEKDLKSSNDLNSLHEWKVILAYLDSSYEKEEELKNTVELVIKFFLASKDEFDFLPIRYRSLWYDDDRKQRWTFMHWRHGGVLYCLATLEECMAVQIFDFQNGNETWRVIKDGEEGKDFSWEGRKTRVKDDELSKYVTPEYLKKVKHVRNRLNEFFAKKEEFSKLNSRLWDLYTNGNIKDIQDSEIVTLSTSFNPGELDTVAAIYAAKGDRMNAEKFSVLGVEETFCRVNLLLSGCSVAEVERKIKEENWKKESEKIEIKIVIPFRGFLTTKMDDSLKNITNRQLVAEVFPVASDCWRVKFYGLDKDHAVRVTVLVGYDEVAYGRYRHEDWESGMCSDVVNFAGLKVYHGTSLRIYNNSFRQYFSDPSTDPGLAGGRVDFPGIVYSGMECPPGLDGGQKYRAWAYEKLSIQIKLVKNVSDVLMIENVEKGLGFPVWDGEEKKGSLDDRDKPFYNIIIEKSKSSDDYKALTKALVKTVRDKMIENLVKEKFNDWKEEERIFISNLLIQICDGKIDMKDLSDEMVIDRIVEEIKKESKMPKIVDATDFIFDVYRNYKKEGSE